MAGSSAPATNAYTSGDPDVDAVLRKSAGLNLVQKFDPSAGSGDLSIGPVDTGVKTPQWLNRVLAGAGKGMTDIARGAGQFLGLESRQNVQDSRDLDEPLMATGAGKTGDVIGTAAVAAPTAFIPGANTAVGAGLVGAVMGALQPSTSDKETLGNIGSGALLGSVGQAAGSALGKGSAALLGSRAPSVTDQALLDGQKLGYVVPPATSNPSLTNKFLEGAAGKLTTAQQASIKNQTITNGLVRSEFGLPEDAPLTSDTMDAIRAAQSPAYQAVKTIPDIQFGAKYNADLTKLTGTANKITAALPNYKSTGSAQIQDLVDSLKPTNGVMDGETAVELSKSLRSEASSYLTAANRTGDPQARALGTAYRGAAEAVENAVEDHLTNIGQPDLAANWDAARTTIAKTYSVENALDGAGNVDATKLGKQLLKGKPLSGNLEAAANFANAFPKAARNLKESVPGISPLDVYSGAAIDLATGNHAGLALGPGRMALRSGLLSPAGQALARPPVGPPGVLATGTGRALQGASVAARPLALGTQPLDLSNITLGQLLGR